MIFQGGFRPPVPPPPPPLDLWLFLHLLQSMADIGIISPLLLSVAAASHSISLKWMHHFLLKVHRMVKHCKIHVNFDFWDNSATFFFTELWTFFTFGFNRQHIPFLEFYFSAGDKRELVIFLYSKLTIYIKSTHAYKGTGIEWTWKLKLY